MTNRVYLSLGANQQDPVRRIALAANHIQHIPKTHTIKSSEIILTEPFGVVGQPLFYNQVIQIATQLTPLELLNACQAIENRLGRTRHLRWGPRIIDIDILSYNQLILHHPRLTLPHPQIWTRSFISNLLLGFKDKTLTKFIKNPPV